MRSRKGLAGIAGVVTTLAALYALSYIGTFIEASGGDPGAVFGALLALFLGAFVMDQIDPPEGNDGHR